MTKIKHAAAFWLLSLSAIFLATELLQAKEESAIPGDCRQLLLVIVDSNDKSPGILHRFERTTSDAGWQIYKNPTSVIVGKNGLAWGRGLQKNDSLTGPLKEEGDHRSPAGIFKLSAAFGFTPVSEISGLNIPYIEITEMTECIDDPGSRFYNQLISTQNVDTKDWHSSEKMRRAEPWYEWGIIIGHNQNPQQNRSGSCIFLHNWAAPDDSTVGCTAMAPENMKELIYWLDSKKKPVLVQLSRKDYESLIVRWKLPDIRDQLFRPGAPKFSR